MILLPLYHPLAAVFAAAPCICFPFVGLISLACTAFWIWMIVEVATKEPSTEPNKVVWILVVVLCGIIGAAIYFFVRRPERIQKYGA